jgi:hypothetical protein
VEELGGFFLCGHKVVAAWKRQSMIMVQRGVRDFSHCCRVRRGPGGPRDSRPGGRRYLFLQ